MTIHWSKKVVTHRDFQEKAYTITSTPLWKNAPRTQKLISQHKPKIHRHLDAALEIQLHYETIVLKMMTGPNLMVVLCETRCY